MLTRRRLVQAPLLIAASIPAAAAPQVQRVIYPAPESPTDQRSQDMVALLQAALQRTEVSHGPFTLAPAAVAASEDRQLLNMEQGQAPTVVWASATAERERRLLAIRIPARRGLLGYRVALIHRARQAEFSRIRTLDDLRAYSLGQGPNWPEVQMYRQLRFKVQTGSYEALFRMLVAGRFDLFPRGINEVFDELAAHQSEVPDLAVEDTLLIHYPQPYYFFVNRRDTGLAQRIELGLRAMLRDGSFEAHFWRFHGNAIQQARLGERRLLRLENPLLPPDTPLADGPLWFDPKAMRRP
ncbi:MAG: amino acid ABC transporter substrate-binding protein [Burkholderiales bacterium]|nr:amino acid ABC transporter substrate-binding protein [Burkholderiales bacterium]